MAKRKTLTVDMVKKQIQVIKDVAKTGDFEHAYSAEIELYQEVLKQVVKETEVIRARDCTDDPGTQLEIIRYLAREALKASKIKFTRVTA